MIPNRLCGVVHTIHDTQTFGCHFLLLPSRNILHLYEHRPSPSHKLPPPTITMPTASKKKRRSTPQADEDDDEIDEARKENLENGGEVRRNSRDKRRKLDDAEEDDEMEEAPASPMRNPKSRNIDNSPIRDRHTNPIGKPAEAGIIHEVYVENFMCHRKLTVQLCRNVNFIHGQNGSGKSAILAAIQVCLGANAKRTHRARNLKDLVRKEAGVGCTGAKLRVTLLNRGSDGYQPEVYGDYITVERSISLGGGYNGFKLLDSTGKERSRNKKDLYAMLDQLNIQVDNPGEPTYYVVFKCLVREFRQMSSLLVISGRFGPGRSQEISHRKRRG